MSDAVSLARAARESLARGLHALQGDPNVPPHLVELAAPIAQAMGALHRIESSGGAQLAVNADAALSQVQSALAGLQAQPPTLPAVAAAMEAVAGALGSVHALTRAAKQRAPVPQAAPAPQPPMAQAAPTYAPVQTPQPFQAMPQYAPVQTPQPIQPMPQYAQAPRAPAPQQQAQPAYAQPAPQAYPPAPLAAQAPARPPVYAAADPFRPTAAGNVDAIAAELGAHSPSNFYKGLSGNDIVDHGGLFVSTYKLPQLGSAVRLRISLPGGYEFEANAVVRWRREASDSGTDAPPGFGAQFTEISAEARQLVYRYVRNREPLFHDDL